MRPVEKREVVLGQAMRVEATLVKSLLGGVAKLAVASCCAPLIVIRRRNKWKAAPQHRPLAEARLICASHRCKSRGLDMQWQW